MSDKGRADIESVPPTDANQEHESWLREAARAPLPARLPAPGEIVGGKYRIEELLGRGGMGVVFRGRHTVSEKTVALKWMLRPSSDEQARKRFEREARAAGRIDHPNVVDLYDVGEEGECSYLVMELLRGESLRRRIARGALAVEEAVELLVPAMRGVAAAHRAGVIHRDLKPDNIFLCNEREGGQREIKVLDFGISSIASLEAADSTLTHEGMLLGSLAYMSPEQLVNPHDVDVRTDVYAFGVILFEMLTGELPFRAANQSGLIVAITSAQPKRLSQTGKAFPAGLEDVVLQALARSRDERFASIGKLIEALLPFASAEAQRAGRTSLGAVAANDVATTGNPANGPSAKVLAESAHVSQATGPKRRAPIAVWIAATALIAIGLWALSGLLRATQPPDVARDQAARSATAETAEAVHPAATPPASAPPPATQPVVPALAPAKKTHEAQPAPLTTRAPRPRSKAKPRPRDERPNDREADEEALFSGRK